MSRTSAARASIDASLIRMRRLWNTATRQTPVDAPGAPGLAGSVELSTVLVTDAVHRLRAPMGSPAAEAAEVGVAEVASQLGVTPSTASRLVDRATASGAVTRTAGSLDARRAALHVTPDGERLLVEAAQFRQRYLRDVLDGWTDEEVVTFAALLDRFAQRVHARPPGPRPERRTTPTSTAELEEPPP
jgi:DNA-binding MarR family transcriptional regulator